MVPSRPQTKTGTPRLSDLARHVIVPSGIVSTGWPAVRDKCLELGVTFDLWQDGAGRLVLSKRADGRYATTIGGVVISIPRQVGKTYLLGAIVFALCLLFPGLTVIWTAHRLRTAAETFQSMQGMARRAKIKPHVEKVILGSGEEEIRFRNGSRILFGARERGFGRGFSMVDVLVFDEAQILTENAIDDMVPATNQAPNPLILFTGTPPKRTDPSEVFRRKRAEALAGESDDTVYIEFSADPDADPSDWAQVRKANPSHPTRTPREAILRMRKNLTQESYLREALGIWDDLEGRVISLMAWRALVDAASQPSDPVAFAVDINPDRTAASIGTAGRRSDGGLHVEVVEHRQGTGWVVDRLVELQKHKPCVVMVDSRGPAASLLPELEERGVKVTTEPTRGTGNILVVVNSTEMARACGAFYDAAVDSKTLRHLDQPDLNEALAAARKRDLGDSWAWHRKNSAVDISPLVAVTLAAHGLAVYGPQPVAVPLVDWR